MEEEPWSVEWTMGIDQIRALHSSIDYLIKVWPGSPARPAEEQVFLQDLRATLFAMILDHNFNK